jgi:hypothetical protein
MSLADAWQNIEQHLKADAESVKARIEQDLPEVGRLVQDAASNPVTMALSAAVHLPQAPEVLQVFADMIAKADAALGAAKAAGAAEAQQAAPEVPADPAPAPSA